MAKPIFEEYFRQRSDLTEASKTPRTVVFSPDGLRKALKELEDNGLTHNSVSGPSPTYCGLHRCIDHDLKVDIVVTEKTQAEWFGDRQRNRQNAITIKIDGIMGGAPVAEIVAANLTAAQLCDIIQAWLDSDDHSHFGAFEHALKGVLIKEGRYED